MMKIINLTFGIVFCVLLFSCKNKDTYDKNKAFNTFLQTEFSDYYKKKRGFEEVSLDELKKSGVCRVYNDLDFQIIYFCPFYQTCYQIIHDFKQRKFYVQKNEFKEPYTEIVKEQLDRKSNQTYYITEEIEKHPYHLISEVLDNRYKKLLMPKEAFEELALFLSSSERGSVSIMNKDDIIVYYNEEIEADCIYCSDSKEALEFKNIFKQQINYVYSKMDDDYFKTHNSYFVVIKNSNYSKILTFELKIFNPYNGLEPWFNEAEIQPSIKYSLEFKSYPIYF